MAPFLVISFSSMDTAAASKIVHWRYEPPYEIYNLEDSAESIQYILDPQYSYHSMHDEKERLIGFCSFGEDGQVPGGDYSADALDIGMGIHPDLTGQGLGSGIARAVLDFAQRKFQSRAYRVTIAAFNQRAQKVWKTIGFKPFQTFTHKDSNRQYIIMIMDSVFM
jgi:ribosomal-protein-alanine N-acetyltransferase